MRQVYLGLWAWRGVRKPSVTHGSVANASNTPERNCGAVGASVPREPPTPDDHTPHPPPLAPFLTRPPFQTLKYTKTCTVYTLQHVYTNSLFPLRWKIQAFSEREKNISADVTYTNAHKPPLFTLRADTAWVDFSFRH